MTLKFTLFSQEVEDFALEIKIDADAKFQELHQLIISQCDYKEHSDQTFLICDDEWKVKEHIYLTDNEDLSSEEDLYLMDSCSISEFLDEEGQHLAYIFDPVGKRFFLLELSEILFTRAAEKATISKKHGKAPFQHSESKEEELTTTNTASELEEDFYGTDGFDDEELDMEGFEINE